MNRVKELCGPNFVQTSWHHDWALHIHMGHHPHWKKQKKCCKSCFLIRKKMFWRIFFEVVTLLRAGSRNLVTWVLTCAQRMNSILAYVICVYGEIPNFKLLYICHLVISPLQVRMLNLFRHQDSKPSLPLHPDIIPSISVCTQISLVSIARRSLGTLPYVLRCHPVLILEKGLCLEHKTRLSQASLTLRLTIGDLFILCHSFVVACHISIPSGVVVEQKKWSFQVFMDFLNPFFFPASFILCLLLFFTKGLLLNWKGNWHTCFPQTVSMQVMSQ